MSVIHEWRIGWAQGALVRAVHALDNLDPGWQQRPSTLRLLGIAAPGKCPEFARSIGGGVMGCDHTAGHLGQHHDPRSGADWMFDPDGFAEENR